MICAVYFFSKTDNPDRQVVFEMERGWMQLYENVCIYLFHRWLFSNKNKNRLFSLIFPHTFTFHIVCIFFFLHPQSLLVLSDQVGLEPHIVAVTNGCANCLPKLYQSCNQPRCLCSTNSSTGQVPKYSGENRFGPSRIGVKKIETSLQRKRKQVHLNVIFIQYA